MHEFYFVLLHCFNCTTYKNEIHDILLIPITLNVHISLHVLSLVQCIDIVLSYCQDVPYRKTVFPNLIGQQSRQEAEQSTEYLLLNVLHGLLGGECLPELRLLGCSVLAPRCQNHARVKPCRSSCEAVKKNCVHAFEAIRMAWPYYLDCDRFFAAEEEGCHDPLSELKGNGQKTLIWLFDKLYK